MGRDGGGVIQMIFQAHLYYFRKNIGEDHFDIVFESEDETTSVSDVHRWAQDRKRCLPDVFGDLVCVKIASYPIGKILDDGFLRTGMCFPFYEWKVDFPHHFDGDIKHGRRG